jgi:hypothetical protein
MGSLRFLPIALHYYVFYPLHFIITFFTHYTSLLRSLPITLHFKPIHQKKPVVISNMSNVYKQTSRQRITAAADTDIVPSGKMFTEAQMRS